MGLYFIKFPANASYSSSIVNPTNLYLAVFNPPPNLHAYSAYKIKRQGGLVTYLHHATFIPIVSTWIKAIDTVLPHLEDTYLGPSPQAPKEIHGHSK